VLRTGVPSPGRLARLCSNVRTGSTTEGRRAQNRIPRDPRLGEHLAHVRDISLDLAEHEPAVRFDRELSVTLDEEGTSSQL
jgi:hypothetical protein